MLTSVENRHLRQRRFQQPCRLGRGGGGGPRASKFLRKPRGCTVFAGFWGAQGPRHCRHSGHAVTTKSVGAVLTQRIAVTEFEIRLSVYPATSPSGQLRATAVPVSTSATEDRVYSIRAVPEDGATLTTASPISGGRITQSPAPLTDAEKRYRWRVIAPSSLN